MEIDEQDNYRLVVTTEQPTIYYPLLLKLVSLVCSSIHSSGNECNMYIDSDSQIPSSLKN